MHYIIDGYNLLFSIQDARNFQVKRNELISYLSKQFSSLELSGSLFFDGSFQSDEISGRCYGSPVEVIYSPFKKSADCSIVEFVEFSKTPQHFRVVTDDQILKKRVRIFGAETLGTKSFLLFLSKKSSPDREEKKQEKETKNNLDRLLKIFEERLKES